MRIVFIGAGNMATALIAGLLRYGIGAERLAVVARNFEAQQQLHNEFRIKVWSHIDADAMDADVIVLAVKPHQLQAVAQQLAPLLKQQLVVSIAAGVRAGTLSDWLQGYAMVVRTMPNTPATVGAGVTALFAMAAVSAAQREQASAIMQSVGSTLWLEDETLLDAVTAMSGSGPAYIFYFMEAMQQAGIRLGLSTAAARQLTLATFSGAAKLAEVSTEEVAVLRARVTSEGGTTERALLSMQSSGIEAAIVRAIDAAAQRSRELGDTLANLLTSP
ncbi:MAG: pyrroline-5-carboxylate reductase [Sulfuriferula sp.]